MSGARTPVPVAELQTLDPASYHRLVAIADTLERHYRDMCDLEFTIEDGRLWMLQTRIGKRSAAAAFRIAADQLGEGTIDPREALLRVTGDQLAQLMFPRFDPDADHDLLTRGVGASPGAAVGRIVFDAADATACAARAEAAILVRRETRAEDVPGMASAAGVTTSRGGTTSHAAVVARGMGRPCVVGASALAIDLEARSLTVADGPTLSEGDVVSIDGASGEVFWGAVPVVPSPVVKWLESEGADPVSDPMVEAVAALMKHADAARRLRVRANADTGPDAARALRFGAEGIGLARTEHMFLGERRLLVERLVLADDEAEQAAVLDELLPLQRADFAALFEAMEGRPVTIRLIDPPLHEFLPDLTELAARVAVNDERHEPSDHDHQLLAAVTRLHEENPMLGLRGVRLAVAVPGLIAMQTRAILEAAADLVEDGKTVDPEVMVPLVSSVRELALERDEITRVAHEVAAESGVDVPFRVGAMVELPRAALTAGEIAVVAQFLSFGTNDLTQMTWGMSRDDVEASVLRRYLDLGVLEASPFETLDVEGVGELVHIAVTRARATNPAVRIGVCGEHGGDPSSIDFFDAARLDYVSCSPFRVPVARLEAGRAAVAHAESTRGPMTVVR